MTRKHFWQDPYLARLETRLSAVQGQQVQLVDSIFYAFSGGQESDEGSIGGRRVLCAEKRGLELCYTLESTEGMAPGDPVMIEIDWPRRYALMRLHFAAELVLELVTRLRPGMEKIGAHIGADKARVDFICTESIASLFAELEPQLAHWIAADLPIVSAFSDETQQRRYWQVEGLARVPCGGTHLKRTGEVGALRLKRKNIGKGKERIEIHLCPPTLA